MSLNITQPLPGLSPMPGGAGAAGPTPPKPPQETDFSERLNAVQADSAKIDQNQATQAAGKTDSVNAMDSVNKTRNDADVTRVNGKNDIPDQKDPFGHQDHVRGEFNSYIKERIDTEKLVSDGKLKATDPKVVSQRQGEMRNLLHFQMEMQGAAMKVEIATKMVDHATSGLKTVISTQA